MLTCEVSKKDEDGKIQGSVNKEDEDDEADNEIWTTRMMRRTLKLVIKRLQIAYK